MNTYSDYFGLDGAARRSSDESDFGVGLAIGSLITATVFGLTRGIVDRNRRAAREPGSDEVRIA